MVLHHPLNIQVLNSDKTVSVHECTGKLMMKVGLFVANLAMDFRNFLSCFLPVGRPFFLRRQTALFPHQFLLGFPQVFWILDHGSIGKNGKGFDAHINTNGIIGYGNLDRLGFNGEASVPPIAVTSDCAGLHSPGNIPVKYDLDGSNLGEPESLRGKLKAGLLR
jgi:hypothetical protein